MIGPLQRALLLSIIPFVAMGVVGSVSSSSAEVTTSHSRSLRRALKPGVQAGQRISSTVWVLSPRTVAKSKIEILAQMNVVLKSLNSVRIQLRSAPADVRSSFDRNLSVEQDFKNAVQRASTQHQILLASRALESDLAKVVTFDAYVIYRCEGSAPSPERPVGGTFPKQAVSNWHDASRVGASRQAEE
jgi:hypothetical protein